MPSGPLTLPYSWRQRQLLVLHGMWLTVCHKITPHRISAETTRKVYNSNKLHLKCDVKALVLFSYETTFVCFHCIS